MSLEVVGHVNNRVNSYRIADLLDKTAGKAVRLAGAQLNISKQTSDSVAQQVCLGLQVLLANARGKRFNNSAAAIDFCVGELQYGVEAHIKKHKPHFNGHLLSDEDWASVVAFM